MSQKSDIMIGMSGNTDQNKDLLVVVGYLLGRPVRIQEALSALGMSRSTFYEQRDKGVLNSIPNLMAIADHFNLDKVDLLVRFGHVTKDELLTFLEREGEIIEHSLDPPLATTRTEVRTRTKPAREALKARTDIPPL
ncbi:immunity repressor [Mycobacterium phage OhShagHennessy]|uniref:Immunity repressor n=1 Tax=Mycobacterium phage OhShagHennessy TaxID=2801895 RepID=A0A7U0J6X4_9CAUD|nr:transcriptional repressor [Mycobacterium phage OhShagHennessy]QQV92740.1 immunity repressor [Mycobacterium phage OhShagHennessy]